MWIWECELQRIGFRCRSDRYWQCERRFGLAGHAYLSIFVGMDFAFSGQGSQDGRRLVEFSAFHVTFPLDADNIHFYYHEHADHVREPGGHTSSAEIQRHMVDPRLLRDRADAIASRLVAAFASELLARE